MKSNEIRCYCVVCSAFRMGIDAITQRQKANAPWPDSHLVVLSKDPRAPDQEIKTRMIKDRRQWNYSDHTLPNYHRRNNPFGRRSTDVINYYGLPKRRDRRNPWSNGRRKKQELTRYARRASKLDTDYSRRKG